MRAEAKLIALSIVVAGALAGVGVYASRASVDVAGAPVASVECPPVAAADEPASARQTRAPPPTRPTPRESTARTPDVPRRDADADRALQRQLDAAKPRLTKECWSGADGGVVSVRVRVLFEAGVQRHVSVEGAAEHPDLADCVRRALPPLTATASSAVASVGSVTFP